jgi:PKD repeat protein
MAGLALACRHADGPQGPPVDGPGETGRNGRGPLPPIARAGGPYVGNGSIRFDGRGSEDPDSSLPLVYAWDFGDGHTGSGPTPVHAYATDGKYTVTLRVTDATGVSSAPDETTATISDRAAPAELLLAGNIATCGREGHGQTAALLDGLAGWVANVGDNAYPDGSAEAYRDCYDSTWGRHLPRTLAVLGNHEYDLGHADGAFDYFGTRAGPRGLGYYSTSMGAWQVIVLNSNATHVPTHRGSPQEVWLREELAAHASTPCVLAIWHHPRFYQGPWNRNAVVKPFWDALYEAGADVVVNAHFHLYERYAPQTPDGAPDAEGPRQFTVGTGGRGHDALVEAAPNVEVRDNTSFGVLKLTLLDTGYEWEFMPVAGHGFRDAGAAQCR